MAVMFNKPQVPPAPPQRGQTWSFINLVDAAAAVSASVHWKLTKDETGEHLHLYFNTKEAI